VVAWWYPEVVCEVVAMAKRKGVTLTKKVVDAAEKRDKRYLVWDDELTGFALRIEPTGVKTFVIKYRKAALAGHRTLWRAYS
jgi:hypothetical protein